jgi:hypothetical protein
MTYPYGTKGAPVVGNGLGGLPRRPLPAPPPAPVVVPSPISPYYLSRRAALTNPNQTYAYSPHLNATPEFSDGSTSGQIFYNAHAGTLNYSEKTFGGGNKQIMTTGGNATVWRISPSTDGFRYVYCLKHDLSGMVVMDAGSDNRPDASVNTGCFETVNGVDTFYFMNWDSSTGVMILSRVIPNYATQQAQQAANTILSFNMSGVTRRPYAIFVQGDFLYVLSGRTNAARMHLDAFNKSNLTFSSTRYWDLSSNTEEPQKGFVAETPTALAVRYQNPGTQNFTRAFIIDKATLQGRNYSNSIGGDASRNAFLISDSSEIYAVQGYGSGGSFGATEIRILRPNANIDVATQYFSGATFSLNQSLRATVPNGFSWGSYIPPGGAQTTNLVQVFVPSPTRTFSYSGGSGYSFSQDWSFSAQTPTDGIDITSAPSTVSNPYSPSFWSYNPLGTNYLAP